MDEETPETSWILRRAHRGKGKVLAYRETLAAQGDINQTLAAFPSQRTDDELTEQIRLGIDFVFENGELRSGANGNFAVVVPGEVLGDYTPLSLMNAAIGTRTGKGSLLKYAIGRREYSCPLDAFAQLCSSYNKILPVKWQRQIEGRGASVNGDGNHSIR